MSATACHDFLGLQEAHFVMRHTCMQATPWRMTSQACIKLGCCDLLQAQLSSRPVRRRSLGADEYPAEVVQCLDIVLRSSMSLRPDVATFARGVFLSDPRFCKSIGDGAQVNTQAFILQICTRLRLCSA